MELATRAVSFWLQTCFRSTVQPQRKIADPVFGPYDSRRFGTSLGINPLPAGPKVCTFDCVYCECGPELWGWGVGPVSYVTLEEVRNGLLRAAQVYEPDALDALTIAGNGEPTLHPHLGSLIDIVNSSRNSFWPRARTVILTNGTTSHLRQVVDALRRVDDRIVKFDAGCDVILDAMNRPSSRLTVEKLVSRIQSLDHITLQSMFIHGPADNTGRHNLELWARWIRRIHPIKVQIYTVDREPAELSTQPVAHEKLEEIAAFLEASTGVPATVY